MRLRQEVTLPEPIWQKQEEHDNCFYACLASLLGIPQREIPFHGSFSVLLDGPPVVKWITQQGYRLKFTLSNGRRPVQIGRYSRPYIGALCYYPITEIPRVISSHAVVMQRDEVIWDPSPNGDTVMNWKISDPAMHRAGIIKVMPA